MKAKLIKLIMLVSLLLAPSCILANQRAYDRDEQIRRDAQKLADYDKAQRDAAKERYDEKSSGQGGQALGTLFCLAVIVGMGVWCYKQWVSKPPYT